MRDNEWRTEHPTDFVWGYLICSPSRLRLRGVAGAVGYNLSGDSTDEESLLLEAAGKARKGQRLKSSNPIRTNSRLFRWTRGLGTLQIQDVRVFLLFYPAPQAPPT